MKNLVLACVVALAFCPMAAVADIAISTQANWWSQDAADREMQEIVDNVTAVVVEQFAADQQDALADWVVAHTGDGVADLLILCGQFPDTIYPSGNAEPDGSLAELFLDDGNVIVNTGDYMFYVVNGSGANASAGLYNMMDITVDMWDDNTPVVVTADGLDITPTLVDFQTDRPFHLDQLQGPWFAELILAQNDAGTRADPVIVANVDTGGRLGIFYQTASQDDDPRGEVISEWINNWYLTAGEVVNPGFPAESPNPEDGAVDVITPLFQWTAGYGAAMHEVYFGTDPQALVFKTTMPSPMYFHLEPLEPGATYYWRIDEVQADGTKVEGNVWSFTVTPMEAHFPSPSDGALWRRLDTQLGWTAGQSAQSHDVYFGTDPAALEAVATGLTETTFAPEGLAPLTTYYWRVDETTADALYEGPVWSFSTIDPEGGCVAEYWANMSLAGPPDVVTTEAEVNWDFNAERDSRPHPDIPVDQFSCRWTAELNVPVTGTYTLYEASDDGARMYLNGELVAEGWYDRGTTEDSTGPLELVAGEAYLLVMEMYENGGGATAYLRWEGPGYPKEIIPQGALQIPTVAISPTPADGAENVENMPVLSWLPGNGATLHLVYFSTDEALVAAGDASVLLGSTAEASIAVAAPLDGDTTYYWKVDTETADGAVKPGAVWSFTVRPDVMTSPEAWESVAAAGAPGFLATDVENGTYDIGTFGGEQTYEFIVQSNPDEQEPSMVLIGRLSGGDTRVALKYEQYDNLGTYGATVFGVTDYDYGVANNPGVPTHLVFVSSEASATTTLYVDGAARGSVPAAIPLSGVVGIGRAIREDGTFIDNFDGEIFGVAIYDRALSNGEIRVHADAYLMRGRADITAPGDTVKGVPDDGDWPAAETPPLAIDDNTGTKYLHRKGGSMATGFQVEPAVGPTIVTGLTFTTANDDYGRDPTSFELSGSNESIDGPYEVVAAGDIVDFAQEELWPRFTMNATPITFENAVAYKYYQVLFTSTLRANNDGLMQIAEVELIGVPEFVLFSDDFESYAVGSDLHGQSGWKGWNNDAGAGAPASDAFASSGSVSVELIGSADLVHEFDVAGGTWKLSAMQYIPSGTTGETWFILMNSYDDGANQGWSVDYKFNLDTGIVTSDETGATATIVYDQWVALEFVIDLDANTVDGYYNGALVASHVWDNNAYGATIGAIDLWANGASSIYYDDVAIERF